MVVGKLVRWAWFAFLAVGVAVGGAPTLLASTAEDCGRITESAARLACYDAVYSSSPPEPPVRAPSSADARPVQPAAVAQPEPAPAAAASSGSAAAESPGIAPSAVSVAAQPAAPAAAPSREESEFGVPSRSPLDRPGRAVATVDEDSLTTTVAAVRRSAKQSTIFRLANGQIWMQTVPREVPIDEGDRVTIRRGLLGGYMLRNRDGVATRVGRVR